MQMNTIRSEVLKFYSRRILPHQSGAKFFEGVESQAKVLENLGREGADTSHGRSDRQKIKSLCAQSLCDNRHDIRKSKLFN